MLLNKIIIFTFVLLTAFSAAAFAQKPGKPVATDSRIKTLVYSENEVYHITVQYGYQTSVEFGVGEDIQTISMGNSFILDATPVGRRIFLKPLEDNSKTNLSVITSKRSYYFEIVTKSETDVEDEELAYAVRFYYPEKDSEFDEAESPTFPNSNAMGGAMQPVPGNRISSFNFNYTLRGPERASPVRVFDDGQSTYLQFEDETIAPSFSVIENNKENPIYFQRVGPYFVINQLLGHFILRSGYDLVCIYNERMNSQPSFSQSSLPSQQQSPL